MSDQEKFLDRWSRRKRAVEVPADDRTKSRPTSNTGDEPIPPAADGKPEPKPEEAFDLTSLPSVDSITSATDVTTFLRNGVPVELTRAALRRAWEADPAIRDFIGLSENAWDFNNPNAIPGFGPLDHTPEQVRHMVSELFGDTRRVADKVAEITEGPLQASTKTIETNELSSHSKASPGTAREPDAALAERSDGPAATSVLAPATDAGKQDTAMRQIEASGPAQPRRRTHGGALPQ